MLSARLGHLIIGIGLIAAARLLRTAQSFAGRQRDLVRSAIEAPFAALCRAQED